MVRPPYIPMEVPFEVIELTPRWLTGGLAASFARVQILVSFYDGDPQLWQEAIERGETPGDELDLSFLDTITRRIADDPKLIDDLRRIVGEFAARAGNLA
ncbi:MAG TPA: hypothetical protein VGQ36_02105 [Thermoanaerobaculia bacterium]|nr:hypothetical protein [Thermoanaerobaculia bacterium]